MKKTVYLKLLASGIFAVTTFNAGAATPLFTVIPRMTAQNLLINGEQGTGIFQVTNTSGRTLADIGVNGFPGGMSTIPNAGYAYCSYPFSLGNNSSCLLKVSINSAQAPANIQGGPQVCYTSGHPVYCSQPLAPDQLNIQVNPGPIPTNCLANAANFDSEEAQQFQLAAFTTGWGPQRACLTMGSSNPNVAGCPGNDAAGIQWQQQRIIAAADFWIKQKLNYCHHYIPDYNTIPVSRGAAQNAGGYCNPEGDLMPGTPYYLQQARWNYTGTGSDTIDNWVNNNLMWYGMDCSNYTSFLYDFSFGTVIDSDTAYQAGQLSPAQGESCPGPLTSCQDNLSPNQQSTAANMQLSNPNAAGTLLCADGTLDQGNNTFCAGHGNAHGNYLSAIDRNGNLEPAGTITADMLAGLGLQPGDLLFIAGGGISKSTSPNTSEVTHVVMWTGKQIGTGPNNINPALIAPDDECPQSAWTPVSGEWVITDSHYQGPDYRALTSCFYLNQLWGVRRVIPVAQLGPQTTPNVNCADASLKEKVTHITKKIKSN